MAPALNVEAEEVRLHLAFNEQPDGKKPVLLFAHGFPDDHQVWSRQWEALSGAFHVAAFDLRGVGKSSAPRHASGYRYGEILPDFDRVIDALVGDSGQVHLIGHDWGALLGWVFASQPAYARRLRSFTAMASPHPDLIAEALWDRGRQHGWREVLRQLRKFWYVAFFQLPALPEQAWQKTPQKLWVGSHKRGGVPADDPYLQVTDEEVLGRTLRPLALYRENLAPPGRRPKPQPTELPTCLLIPDRDLVIEPWLYDPIGRYFQNLETHHLDANHWLQREKPDDVTALIRDFVMRH